MPKKRLGQNFLFDPSILRRIVSAAGVTTDDTVVEIGPGHGRLTAMLADSAKRVIAIELDRELYERLKKELSGRTNIDIIHADALKYDYRDIGVFKVVANIPYYITTPVIFRLLEYRDILKSMTLMVQKEVAERIVSGSGSKDYGVLSVMVQYYCNAKLCFRVPAGAFRPAPKVDSAVIHLEVSESPAVRVIDENIFFRVVRTSFSQRRKMLSNSLRPLAGDADIREILYSAGIAPDRRPETLSIDEFAKIADFIAGKLKRN